MFILVLLLKQRDSDPKEFYFNVYGLQCVPSDPFNWDKIAGTFTHASNSYIHNLQISVVCCTNTPAMCVLIKLCHNNSNIMYMVNFFCLFFTVMCIYVSISVSNQFSCRGLAGMASQLHSISTHTHTVGLPLM